MIHQIHNSVASTKFVTPRPISVGCAPQRDGDAAVGTTDHEFWYVVHTHTHYEMRVIEHLQRQLFTAFCPYTRKSVRHARRTETKQAPFFPNYVFVQLDASQRPWRCINGTIGVVRLITNGETPAPVPVGIVEHLHILTAANGVVNWVPPLKAGDPVRISTGPFAALVGTLEHLDASGRARVLLNLLGREVSVALSGGAISSAA
jgi:transcriptional antiterminator RfaH